MQRTLLAIALMALAPAGAFADCRGIVEATVAELRAAYPDWSPQMETLARTAAGSACVKAGYGQSLSSSEVAPAAGAESTASAGESAAAKTEGEKKDEGWYPFKDITFNEVTANPTKKPYERRRQDVD